MPYGSHASPARPGLVLPWSILTGFGLSWSGVVQVVTDTGIGEPNDEHGTSQVEVTAEGQGSDDTAVDLVL